MSEIKRYDYDCASADLDFGLEEDLNGDLCKWEDVEKRIAELEAERLQHLDIIADAHQKITQLEDEIAKCSDTTFRNERDNARQQAAELEAENKRLNERLGLCEHSYGRCVSCNSPELVFYDPVANVDGIIQPQFQCKSCGFTWTDYGGERIRDMTAEHDRLTKEAELLHDRHDFANKYLVRIEGQRDRLAEALIDVPEHMCISEIERWFNVYLMGRENALAELEDGQTNSPVEK